MIFISAEAEELVRCLAEHNGKTPEQVVEEVIEAEARVAGIVANASEASRKNVDIERVGEIVRRISGRLLRDRRPARDILDEAWGRSG